MTFIYGSWLGGPVRLALAVLFFVAVAATADARFADAQGFSGKHGVTCVSCHFPEVIELGTPATVALDGLPATWDWSSSYLLKVVVSGGPPGNPAPDTPQAGFDLEIDVGALAAGEGMDELVRIPSAQEATYTGIGTYVRSWDLVWTTPDVGGLPTNATFWIGALAANGNHVMNGPNVTGERGDRGTTAVVIVAPSKSAIDESATQILPPPILTPYVAPAAGVGSVLTGAVSDFADGAEVRTDNGSWHGATGSPGFSFVLPPWTSGHHVIEARAVWNERVSEGVVIAFDVADGDPIRPATASDGPASGLWVWLVLLLAFPLVPLLMKLRR